MATQIDIDGMFLMLLQATAIYLTEEQQENVIQYIAYKLNEWYNVSLDELRSCMTKMGFKLREYCVECNEDMPDFNDIGDPICDKCSSDI